MSYRIVLRFIGMLALTALAGLQPVSVRADSEGYIDQWEGRIRAEYAHLRHSGTREYDVQNLAIFPPSLSIQFNNSWVAAQANQPNNQGLCQVLEKIVEHAKWEGCTFGTNSELRGRMLNTNVIALKYIVQNNQIAFTTDLGSPLPDAEVRVTFDVELGLAISFEPSVDGSVLPMQPAYRTRPSSLQFPSLKVHNVRVSAQVPIPIFPELEGTVSEENLNSKLKSQAAGFTTALSSVLQSTNALLHDSAKSLSLVIFKTQPTSNAYFLLRVAIDADGWLAIQYRRDGDAPSSDLPKACTFSTGCNELVTFDCPMSQDIVQLQRKLADDHWWTVNTDQSIPRFSHTPIVQDSPPTTGPTEVYRVCNVDLWGSACSDMFTVSLNHNRCLASTGNPPRRCGLPSFPKCPRFPGTHSNAPTP